MKHTIQAVAVVLLAALAAHAQQAVQWRVEDGGNGHWYQLSISGSILWSTAKAASELRGGHLATLTADPEKRFVHSVVASVPGFGESAVRRWGPWLGGFQDRSAPSYAEPRGGWRWVTGEAWSYTAWPSYQPDNWCAETQAEEDYLTIAGYYLQADGAWNDLPGGGCDNDPVVSYVIEWSADCNSDGVVDYGQCRDGSLPDYDGDNTPDCCEAGTPCVVGNYPVQWRAEDGGNGHWYGVLEFSPNEGNWITARVIASTRGAHLATLVSAAESEFVWVRLASNPSCWRQQSSADGPLLGGIRTGDQWSWVTEEPWTYSEWGRCYPSFEDETVLAYGCTSIENKWNNLRPDNDGPIAAITEWSADCNNDGIVDYGQILTGQFADTNANGIPDLCEQPTCADADIYRDFDVNGADLGILLSQWGPNTPLTESDLNDDGVVNGADLGILLSFWGPCTH